MYPSSVGNVIIHATSLSQKEKHLGEIITLMLCMPFSITLPSSFLQHIHCFPSVCLLLAIETHVGKVMGSELLMDHLSGAPILIHSRVFS